MPTDPLVTPDWLAAHLDDPGVRVVDMRGYVATRPIGPGVEEATYRGAREEYLSGHIPGAIYIDWTRDIIDAADPVPVQLAPPARFAETMGALGIGDDTHVVAYDHLGGQFATRLWWALHAMGHDAVSVLDGGWNRWVEEGRDAQTGEVSVAHRSFSSRPQPGWRITAEALAERLGDPALQLVDARDTGQFTAARRRGPRGGHIPGALSLPRERFFAKEGGFLPVGEIASLARDAGLRPDRPVVAYCNGGVAATVVLFNLHRAGFPLLTNYDGSWNEWGARPDLPIEP